MKAKGIFIFLATLTICGVLTTVLFVNSSAQSNESNQAGTSAQRKDVFTAGQDVEIKSDSIYGDVAAAGANVNIAGNVQGYLMAAGANVNVSGPVGNDLWAAGANVTVNNSVADNAMLAGSSVILSQNAAIGNDARIAASTADVRGRVTRNLNISAATAQISSEVGGDVEANVANLTLNPGAVIRGNLIVNSPNAPTISPQAQVLGRIDHRPTSSGQSSTSSVLGSWLGNWIITFLWIAILGLVAIWFSPVWTNRVAETLKMQTGKAFLVGLIATLLVPIVFVILLITVVGLPLAFLLGALAVAVFLLSGAFMSYIVGGWFLRLIKRWEDSNVLKVVFGALIITFVMTLPWVGWLAKLVVLFFGAGAFLLERRDLIYRLREHSLA